MRAHGDFFETGKLNRTHDHAVFMDMELGFRASHVDSNRPKPVSATIKGKRHVVFDDNPPSDSPYADRMMEDHIISEQELDAIVTAAPCKMMTVVLSDNRKDEYALQAFNPFCDECGNHIKCFGGFPTEPA